jgi:hypothetical protein
LFHPLSPKRVDQISGFMDILEFLTHDLRDVVVYLSVIQKRCGCRVPAIRLFAPYGSQFRVEIVERDRHIMGVYK